MDKPSNVWSSISNVAFDLAEGLGWQIGNGRHVNIKKHRWGFEGLSWKDADMGALGNVTVVRDMWQHNKAAWDSRQVKRIFGNNLGDRICNYPLVREEPEDNLIWYHENNGIYSTKSGYSWLILRKLHMGPHRYYWKAIWKLGVPPKIRIFAWHLGHNLLPTNIKIAMINPNFSRQCPRCKVADETVIHSLRDCHFAHAMLTKGGIDNRILSSTWTETIDWLEACMRWLDCRAFDCFMIILWNLWNARNNLVFKGEEGVQMPRGKRLFSSLVILDFIISMNLLYYLVLLVTVNGSNPLRDGLR